MDMNDFSKGQIWSIVPERLDAMMERFREIKLSPELAAQAAAFRPAQAGNGEKPYVMNGACAVIPVTGPLSKRVGWLSLFFGGMSYSMIVDAYRAALADPAVQAIVLDIESPGGTVSGTESTAEMIFEARKDKPCVAFANGTMCSAAYWIGSAASKVVAESTAQVGSIGVLMVHYDFSRMDEKWGIKRTYLTAGKFKALGNDAEPLSREARAEYEDQLDQFYQHFVSAVSLYRGKEKQAVLDGMADGRIFIGKQAVAAGLADRIGNLQTAVDLALSLAGDERKTKPYNAGGRASGKEFAMDPKDIKTSVQLAAAYPELVAQIRDEAAKGVDLAKPRTEGASAEKERILGLAAIQFGEEPGGKFKALVDSGISVEAFKAVKALEPPPAKTDESAEDKKKAEMLAAIKASGAANPGAGKGDTASGKDFLALVDEYEAVHKVPRHTALQKVMGLHPEKHREYIQGSQIRQVK
jgi:signal peptide peptidase SppA